MNDTMIQFVYALLACLFICLIIYMIADRTKQVNFVKIRRKIISYYGLGGYYYEYKVVEVNYFYGNSQERLCGEWSVSTTYTNGSENKREKQ